MHDIDFLPVEYRQKHARRQSQPWQIVVAISIVGLVAAAALAQQYRWRCVQNDMQAIAPAYDSAMNQQQKLAEIQKECRSAKSCADLYTYLDHPWPRTQLLSALLTPLPDSVTLQQVQILREAPAAGYVASFQPPLDKKAEEEKLQSLTPAERDLDALSRRFDPMRTVVVLTGTATDVAALHHYIGALDAKEIFDKAELDSLNSVGDQKSGISLQFRAVMVVQPGYGQPSGPTGSEKIVTSKIIQKP